MENDVDSILISRDDIDGRVKALGAEIAQYYPETDGIVIVAVLSGSIIFLADLMRYLPIKLKIGLITVSSYRGATTESLGPKLMKDLSVDVRGRDVLIVDDILDTGNTLRMVQSILAEHDPRSLRTCVLLRKPSKAPSDVSADFIGFDIEDDFVVGYGLDFDDLYRNYPHIAVLKPELYEGG